MVRNCLDNNTMIIALWQAVAMLGWVNPQVLPSPLAVVQKWIAYLLPMQPYTEGSRLAWIFSGELIIDSIGSMYRVLVGFFIGAGLALPIGLAMGASPRGGNRASVRSWAWPMPRFSVRRVSAAGAMALTVTP